ncbi:hypothetical protein AB4Y89_22230 [Terriglobus sp. 2YAB30_2]|uniref:hypothetical protein n=1 Tax=Terriglobus sp. 2YAB30_2 TaxID=3233023 RepID=UPI003F9D5C6E
MSCLLFAGPLYRAYAEDFSPQEPSAQDQTPSATTGRQPMDPDEVVDMLAARLNLTEDQKTQIKPIIADRQQKLRDLREDSSSRPMQRMRKAKKIVEDSDKKIEPILNDQQKQQYAQIKEQMKQQARARMQNRGTGNMQ